MFVADSDNNRIQVFGLDGTFKRKWGVYGTGDGQFDSPTGIDVYNDEVFVVEEENDRIQVFGLDGTFKRKWGSSGTGDGQFGWPEGINVYNSEVFVVDNDNNRIQVFETIIKLSHLTLMGVD